MIKSMFAVGALALAIAAPAAAQMAAPAAGSAMPKCSATVRDSCDQSMTTERYAMSAEAAMKTGGVGDRKSDNAGKMTAGDKPMMAHKMGRKHMMHHKMMMKKDPAMMAPATDAAAKPM